MTFNTWLRMQRKRDGPVGNLARAAMRDRRRKQSSLTWWHRHLSESDAYGEAHEPPWWLRVFLEFRKRPLIR
jgi:hypothetical protein